jgi:ketosteroid isomerase-like protein/phenylpyruvate tautomerase PptA (4-oxalocrotonate tautomerase family)
MPVIRTTLLQGFSTPEERSELAIRLADTLIDVYGEIARPYIYSIVDEVLPGAWYMQGQLATDEMIAHGFVEARQFRAKRVTRERVDAAYTALASGDRTAIEEYWDQDMTWLVPGESRISGIKKGLDEFLGFMNLVGELSGNSFVMERYSILVSSDQTVDLSHNTGTRAGDPNRRLSIDVAHVLRWRDGKVIEGRGAIFGTGTKEYDEFWS